MTLFEPSVETYFFFLFLMKPKKPSGYLSGANTIWGQLLCIIRGRLQTFDFTGNVGSGYVKEATEFTSKGNRLLVTDPESGIIQILREKLTFALFTNFSPKDEHQTIFGSDLDKIRKDIKTQKS